MSATPRSRRPPGAGGPYVGLVDEPSREPARSFWLQGLILTAGITAAAIIVLTHDKSPFTFAIPVTVLSIVLATVVTVADARPARARLEGAAATTGLIPDGPGPLPPVTPILRASRSSVADLLSGDLGPDGPHVRLARTRLRGGGDVAVLWTDAPIRGPLTADPHGLAPGATGTADADTLAFTRDHPLRLALAVEEGTLVLAVPVARGEEPPYAQLLEAARAARRRLVANG